MKKNALNLLLPAIFILCVTGNLLSQSSVTGSPKIKVNYDKIAGKIVNNALKVMPGESVIITGTPAELDLLGALLVAVSKAGGKPTIQLSLPEAEKKAFVETPVEYLKITNAFSLMQARAADCFIYTGSTQNPELYSDVSEERLAAARQSYLPLQDAFSMIRSRNVTLGQTGGIPSPAYAKMKGTNYDEMLSVFWNAVDVDYNKMLKDGQQIAKMMKPGSVVKIKNDAGTDLSLKIGPQPIKINSGSSLANMGETGPAQAWLPAGEVYACTDPKSANGTVVVPLMEFRGKQIKNLRLSFANGKLTDMKADENVELIKKALEMSTGDKDVLSIFDIGINQNSRILKNSNYYSWEMGGMVTLVIGDNTWAGGNVRSGTSFNFHLPNTTASIDGVSVVSNGELKTPQ